jgi:hypothetical protein
MADPEAMALLQKISGGPSSPDGSWKNHNLRWLSYLVKQDLDNIALWYWLDDDEDDIPLLPVQNPHICIWAMGCWHYGRIPKRTSTTAASSVTSVMSLTSRRVASAPLWSTPSAG